MGKAQSKAVAERHGRGTAGEQHGNGMGTAWELHGMCESALRATANKNCAENVIFGSVKKGTNFYLYYR
jgi:hypothetical protein